MESLSIRTQKLLPGRWAFTWVSSLPANPGNLWDSEKPQDNVLWFIESSPLARYCWLCLGLQRRVSFLKSALWSGLVPNSYWTGGYSLAQKLLFHFLPTQGFLYATIKTLNGARYLRKRSFLTKFLAHRTVNERERVISAKRRILHNFKRPLTRYPHFVRTIPPRMIQLVHLSN